MNARREIAAFRAFCLYLQPYKKNGWCRLDCFGVFFFLGFGLAVSAQDDPVLMRINGKEVLRSEFERSYNKGGTSVGAGRKALDAYVNKFIDFRLKIEAAAEVGFGYFPCLPEGAG